jgi:uncharacterized membrane protein
VSTARRASPGARARRALAVDVIAAAVLALLALTLAAGLGVLAFFGLPVLLLGLVSIGAERLLVRVRRRRRAR